MTSVSRDGITVVSLRKSSSAGSLVAISDMRCRAEGSDPHYRCPFSPSYRLAATTSSAFLLPPASRDFVGISVTMFPAPSPGLRSRVTCPIAALLFQSLTYHHDFERNMAHLAVFNPSPSQGGTTVSTFGRGTAQTRRAVRPSVLLNVSFFLKSHRFLHGTCSETVETVPRLPYRPPHLTFWRESTVVGFWEDASHTNACGGSAGP
jgi:hypothetical protein